MDEYYYEEFKKYCVDSLSLLNSVQTPALHMNSDFEAIMICSDISPHIELLLKNTILRLGQKWSYTIVCLYSNYRYIYSLCNKISENIKIIKVNSSNEINEKTIRNLFQGEKLLFYNEKSLIVNDNIHEFFCWDYIGSKLINDNYDTTYFGVSLISRSFASDFSSNFKNKNKRIADKDELNKFLSITTNNPNCFCFYNHWFYNKKWKQDIIINKYSQDGLYNPTHYKILNMELQTLSKPELLNHFRNFGFYDKKQCFIKNRYMQKYITEYCDFDIEFYSKHYSYLNPELSQLSNLDLLKHYITIGKQQNKSAFIKNTNDNYEFHNKQNSSNPLVGNCVIFINSSHEVNDETIFLYQYVIYLQENNVYDNVLILDIIYNDELYEYYNLLKTQPIFHCNNFVLLRELLDYYDPKFIYANSLNYLTLNIEKFSDEIISKTIFHFHESIEIIPQTIRNLKNNIIYCSNEKISEQLHNSFGLTNTQIFKPFIRENSNKDSKITDMFGNLNITFGMFGKNNYENGHDIFIKIAKAMPQYNFIWIGGDYDDKFSADNFIHIRNCVDIYKYINMIDYLLITSRNKFPHIILKALYCDCPCIVLENKMTLNIDIEGFYKIKDHNNDFNKVIEFLKTNIKLINKQDQKISSSQYILDNYSKPIIEEKESILIDEKNIDIVDTCYSTPYFNWKHYLILNNDLIENNILKSDEAINHWKFTGNVVEFRKGRINEDQLENYLLIYNSLKKKISEKWNDTLMEDLIKVKCDPNINIDKYIYEKYYYLKYNNENLNKIKNAVVQWIFYDNYELINLLPKKNGFIDLCCYGINTNYFDIEYFFNQYRSCYFNPSNLIEASNLWNIFGKTNNYISSVYSEIYEDVNFDWEYYIKANNLFNYGVKTKHDAFIHWNKYGKKYAFISSNVTMKMSYYEFLKNNYVCNINSTTPFKVENKESNVDFSLGDLREKRCNNNMIHEKDIFFNKINNEPFFSNNFKEINNIDNIDNLFLIIDFPNLGGGTTSFINRIISMYKDRQCFLIARNFKGILYFYINDDIIMKTTYTEKDGIEFLNSNKHKFTKIFINSIIGHSENFINSLFLLELPIDTITHDYSLIYNSPQDYYHCMMSIAPNSYFPINKCNMVISQNIKNMGIYGNHIDINKVVISKLPDYNYCLKKIKTKNKKVIIGVLGNINTLKGYYIVEQIINYSKKNKNIKVIIFGNIQYFDNEFVERYPYENVEQLNQLLIKHKPNLWIETSIWPETYSYTLTLMMITNLPILYQRKRYQSVVEDRLSTYNKAYSYEDLDDLIRQLSKISNNKNQNYFYTIDPNIYFNEFWDSYFGNNIEKPCETINDISTYCIYFPQFHSFPENDKNFYKGFTDINNLDYFIKNIEPRNTFTPSLQDLKLKNITDYNLLLKKDIIQTQFDIIEKYPLNGFAIYYYWFSLNTITNKNMIMGNVIDRFFEPNLDTRGRKVFFIWANEDWTKNVAFGDIADRIENRYTIDNINKNADNLMKYFKHDNYLKIDNMPVFLIHHPWFMTDDELKLTKNRLTFVSIENGFSGVHFVINSMIKKEVNYLQYDFHFDYKHNEDGHIYFNDEGKRMIDYNKYIDNVKYNTVNIKSLCFDFDNRPRLCLPDRIQYASICEKNTEENHRTMIKKTIDSYKTSYKGVNKILLINSWNEWGERLAIEPSNEMGYYYLDLLKEYLEI